MDREPIPHLDETEYREQELIALVDHYYEAIDADDLEAVLSLFASDAVYIRGSKPAYSGIEAIENFFRNQRNLKGRHGIIEKIASPPYITVTGYFIGSKLTTLPDGTTEEQPAECTFRDTFLITNGKIEHRVTEFVGGVEL